MSGPVQMRADNHQLIQPLFIDSAAKVDGKESKIDRDQSGMGWKTERRVEGKDTVMPTTYKMERPQWPLAITQQADVALSNRYPAGREGRAPLQSVVARFKSSCVAAALVRRMSSASLRFASTPARYSGVMSPVM